MKKHNSVAVSELRKILKTFPTLKLAILFGSFATDKQQKESDIDIAVASKYPLAIDEKTRIIEAIALSFRRPVDLVDLQLKHEPILSQVITKGKVIFCDDKRLYAELIKTVVYDAADFLPLRSRILRERRQAWINR